VSVAAYRGLLAEPALRRLAIADAFARLPQGMVSITVLLVAAEHASMAVAGLVAGLYPPLLAVAAPLAGLFLGPVLATLFSGAAAAAPSGSGTETQAWLNSIMNGGAAAGAAAAGALLGSPVLGGTGASRPILALALALGAAVGAAVSVAIGGLAR
jgi:hypothetical protein